MARMECDNGHWIELYFQGTHQGIFKNNSSCWITQVRQQKDLIIKDRNSPLSRMSAIANMLGVDDSTELRLIRLRT